MTTISQNPILEVINTNQNTHTPEQGNESSSSGQLKYNNILNILTNSNINKIYNLIKNLDIENDKKIRHLMFELDSLLSKIDSLNSRIAYLEDKIKKRYNYINET